MEIENGHASKLFQESKRENTISTNIIDSRQKSRFQLNPDTNKGQAHIQRNGSKVTHEKFVKSKQ